MNERGLLIYPDNMIPDVFELAARELLRILAMTHILHTQPKAREDISFLLGCDSENMGFFF